MPQCTITHSGSHCCAFRKHFTPSSKLNPKHQFSPRSNQRWASTEVVEIFLVCVPRSKRSIHVSPTLSDLIGHAALDQARPAQSRAAILFQLAAPAPVA